MKTKFRNERYIQQIRSDRTGLWTFRVRLKGHDKTFYEKDYVDASLAFKKAKQYRDDVLSSGVIDKFIPKTITVDQVYQESYELFPVRVETRRKLENMYKNYISPKEKDIKDVKADDILKDLNAMIEVTTFDTIRRVLSIWRKIIHTAMYKDYIVKDVSMLIKAPKSHHAPFFTVNKVTDRDTILKMEDLLEKNISDPYDSKMYPLLLEWLYLTGMRICEALALTRDDIKKDHVLISKELGSSMDDWMVLRDCKTDLSHRKIPLTQDMKTVAKKACSLHNNDTIFSQPNGSFYNSKDVGDKMHKIGKSHGYDFNMYSIRHLFATDLTVNGVDERTRIELMGHSNIKTTLGYARSNDDLKIKALNGRKSEEN